MSESRINYAHNKGSKLITVINKRGWLNTVSAKIFKSSFQLI